MASQDAASKLKVASVVCFYMGAALVMVFVNKAVLNSTPNLPFTFLAIQCMIAVLLLHLSSVVWNSPIGRFNLPGQVELPKFDLKVVKNLLPVILIGVTGLVFNTLCLANVDASFFQIARGLALPITIAVTVIQTRKTPGLAVILSAFIVTSGFFLGISPASYFTSIRDAPQTATLSIFFGTLSSFFLAIHAILVKSAYAYVDNSVIKFTYWGNLLSAVALIPGIVINGEIPAALELFTTGGDDRKVFIIGSFITGLFGFFLSMASLLSIKVTSPVTHMFSSAARSVLQTVLSVWIFGDLITSNRALSIALITVGAIYYTWIKSARPSSPHPPKAAPPNADDLEKGLLETPHREKS